MCMCARAHVCVCMCVCVRAYVLVRACIIVLLSGVEEGGDRLSLEQSILKLLLHSHVTEQTVLVWLLEGTRTEHSGKQ